MPPKTERFEMRMDAYMLEAIDGWRQSWPGVPSRSEAIRQLVMIGLAAKDVTFADMAAGLEEWAAKKPVKKSKKRRA